MSWSQRLTELGITLPAVVPPVAAYTPAVRTANLVYTSGQLPIVDGALQTACQQACPSQAIVFGNINDKESRVAKLKEDARNYGALSELGVRPRTTYLVRLRNPNPALA